MKTVKEIEQIDIAPTLSILLGVPIPKNNIGTVITDVLSNYDLQQKLMVLTVNGHQVSEVLKYNRQDYDIGIHLVLNVCCLRLKMISEKF